MKYAYHCFGTYISPSGEGDIDFELVIELTRKIVSSGDYEHLKDMLLLEEQVYSRVEHPSPRWLIVKHLSYLGKTEKQ